MGVGGGTAGLPQRPLNPAAVMPHDVNEQDRCTGPLAVRSVWWKQRTVCDFIRKFSFITTERERESCYDTASYDRDWRGETDRQTAIKQVKKTQYRSQHGMAVMCEADLILVEGHWVLSGSLYQLKKAQHNILCSEIYVNRISLSSSLLTFV